MNPRHLTSAGGAAILGLLAAMTFSAVRDRTSTSDAAGEASLPLFFSPLSLLSLSFFISYHPSFWARTSPPRTARRAGRRCRRLACPSRRSLNTCSRSEEHTSELQSHV